MNHTKTSRNNIIAAHLKQLLNFGMLLRVETKTLPYGFVSLQLTAQNKLDLQKRRMHSQSAKSIVRV